MAATVFCSLLCNGAMIPQRAREIPAKALDVQVGLTFGAGQHGAKFFEAFDGIFREAQVIHGIDVVGIQVHRARITFLRDFQP